MAKQEWWNESFYIKTYVKNYNAEQPVLGANRSLKFIGFRANKTFLWYVKYSHYTILLLFTTSTIYIYQ